MCMHFKLIYSSQIHTYNYPSFPPRYIYSDQSLYELTNTRTSFSPRAIKRTVSRHFLARNSDGSNPLFPSPRIFRLIDRSLDIHPRRLLRISPRPSTFSAFPGQKRTGRNAFIEPPRRILIALFKYPCRTFDRVYIYISDIPHLSWCTLFLPIPVLPLLSNPSCLSVSAASDKRAAMLRAGITYPQDASCISTSTFRIPERVRA